MRVVARLHLLASRALHLLDAVFLELGLLDKAVLQIALIGTEAAVGGRQLVAQVLGELVELDGEAREAVVHVGLLGHGAHAPYRLGRVVRAAQERLVPLAEYLALDDVVAYDVAVELVLLRRVARLQDS